MSERRIRPQPHAVAIFDVVAASKGEPPWTHAPPAALNAVAVARDAWARNPTDDAARAYHAMWMRAHRAGVPDAVSDWFYCCQPAQLWAQLRALGLSDEDRTP